MKMYVRWLGAFRGPNRSLKEMLKFELSREDEAACEPLWKDQKRWNTGCRSSGFGLLVEPKAIIREFKNDCWSEYGNRTIGQNPKRLYATQPNNHSNHAEAWFKGHNSYKGIVFLNGLSELSGENIIAIRKASAKFNLPVYCFTRHGEIKEVSL